MEATTRCCAHAGIRSREDRERRVEPDPQRRWPMPGWSFRLTGSNSGMRTRSRTGSTHIRRSVAGFRRRSDSGALACSRRGTTGEAGSEHLVPWVEDDRLSLLQGTIRERLTQPRTFLRVVGLSGVGKSRLCLEALGGTGGDSATGRPLRDLVMYAALSEMPEQDAARHRRPTGGVRCPHRRRGGRLRSRESRHSGQSGTAHRKRSLTAHDRRRYSPRTRYQHPHGQDPGGVRERR